MHRPIPHSAAARRPALVAFTLVAFTLLTAVGCAATGREAGREPVTPNLALVEAAPDLAGSRLGPPAPGQTATVAIVFASWCGHCRKQIAVLAELAALRQDVRIVGVNYRGHEEYGALGSNHAVRAYVADAAPWLRVIPVDEAAWASLGRPDKVPTVLVFDRAGRLVRAFDPRREPAPRAAELDALLPR